MDYPRAGIMDRGLSSESIESLRNSQRKLKLFNELVKLSSIMIDEPSIKPEKSIRSTSEEEDRNETSVKETKYIKITKPRKKSIQEITTITTSENISKDSSTSSTFYNKEPPIKSFTSPSELTSSNTHNDHQMDMIEMGRFSEELINANLQPKTPKNRKMKLLKRNHGIEPKLVIRKKEPSLEDEKSGRKT